MPCYQFNIKGDDGKPIRGFVRVGKSKKKPCADCKKGGDYLCDFPMGNGKTCDRRMCKNHATEIAPDTHYCPAHYKNARKGKR